MALRSKKEIQKDIFQTVYQWGRVGIVVDEKCNTYKSLMRELERAIKKEKNGKWYLKKYTNQQVVIKKD